MISSSLFPFQQLDEYYEFHPYLAREDKKMKVGDTVKIDFAGKKKEGVVHKLFSNTVYLKMDFDHDKGKIVKRKLNEIDKGKSGKKKEKAKSDKK